MNKDKQRIAIAEFCGWRKADKCGTTESGETVWHLKGVGFHLESQMPNYPEDLNAMHEAEKSLTPEQQLTNGLNLLSIIGFSSCDMSNLIYNPKKFFAFYNATASQRAEALLRTIENWVELQETVTK